MAEEQKKKKEEKDVWSAFSAIPGLGPAMGAVGKAVGRAGRHERVPSEEHWLMSEAKKNIPQPGTQVSPPMNVQQASEYLAQRRGQQSPWPRYVTDPLDWLEKPRRWMMGY